MSTEPRTCPACGKGNVWGHEHALGCPEAPTIDEVADAVRQARYCEGLQQWWGTDSDEMHRLDAALSHLDTLAEAARPDAADEVIAHLKSTGPLTPVTKHDAWTLVAAIEQLRTPPLSSDTRSSEA